MRRPDERTLLRKRQLSFLLRFLATLLLIAASASAAEPVLYELRFEKPNTHLLDVTIRAAGITGPTVELAMPAWAPGAYRINDYAMMVQSFTATGPGGAALTWGKTDKQTWRIELNGASSVTVNYKLFGNHLANDWVQYNSDRAFIAGPAAWMYVVGGKDRQIQLRIAPPDGWRIATSLTRGADGTLHAPDYDTFVDSPIQVSDFQEQALTHAGTTYHFVVDNPEKSDFSRFTRDTLKLVEQITSLFPAVSKERAAPFPEYRFIFHIGPQDLAGLEHLNSTSINFPSDWDSKQDAGRFGSEYELKLFVAAHEFYHAWNVKRLRPKPLGPFDYSKEVYTTSLWHAEGVTSYYAQLALVRAGLITPEAYLTSIGQLITNYEQFPGRAVRSLAETSWDTWFPLQGGEIPTNLANTSYSYYDGGQVVSHLLDLAIRNATGNQKSLDDWMRLLYANYSYPNPGYEPEDLLRTASEIAGQDLSPIFEKYVYGREEIPYDDFFTHAGLRLQKNQLPGIWLGAGLARNVEDRIQFTSITPSSPAAEAGLDVGDVITHLDGQEVDVRGLLTAVQQLSPGDVLHLKVSRGGRAVETRVTLGAIPFPEYKLIRVENPTPLQQQIYDSWLGIR